jgi:hypothetical protein
MFVSDTAFIWFNTWVAVSGVVAGAAWAAANGAHVKAADSAETIRLRRNMISLKSIFYMQYLFLTG